MSMRLRILAACFGFVAIIAVLGGLARQQTSRMGVLAVGIYDHAFMNMSYVDQTQEEFLRVVAAHRGGEATLADAAGRADVQKILDQLDIALERAASERTRVAGRQARALVASLPDTPAGELPERLAQADHAIAKLVKKFSADGLDTRDEADVLATHSSRLVLIEVAAAVSGALGVG